VYVSESTFYRVLLAHGVVLPGPPRREPVAPKPWPDWVEESSTQVQVVFDRALDEGREGLLRARKERIAYHRKQAGQIRLVWLGISRTGFG
jgi:hypothetical protein